MLSTKPEDAQRLESTKGGLAQLRGSMEVQRLTESVENIGGGKKKQGVGVGVDGGREDARNEEDKIEEEEREKEELMEEAAIAMAEKGRRHHGGSRLDRSQVILKLPSHLSRI